MWRGGVRRQAEDSAKLSVQYFDSFSDRHGAFELANRNVGYIHAESKYSNYVKKARFTHEMSL